MPSILNATTTNGLVTSADNSGSLQLQTNNGTTAVTIDTSQNVGIGTSSPADKLNVVLNSSSLGGIRLQNTNGSGQSAVSYYNDSNTQKADIWWNNNGSILNFRTLSTDPMVFATNNSERMRITSDGTICMGTTNTDPSGNAVNGLAYVGSASALTANRSGNACVFLGRSTSTGSITIFRYNTADVGNIATNGSNCTYNSTSDYRLKENITPISNALSRVAQLKPVTYTWKKDGSAGEGFIAHELAEVCPEAVTGEKDAVDEEGKPVYQAIDQSVLVATLTAAIQEQQAQIEELKAEVQALKGVA